MKTKNIVLLLLLSLLLLYPVHGYTMTHTETMESITIPIAVWNELKNDWMTLDSELTACKNEMSKIKKPSSELLSQLNEAEKTLKLLQTELEKQSADLITLSKQAAESKTELQTLKANIDKERRIHRRQLWQNRFWCLVVGAGIGFAVHK